MESETVRPPLSFEEIRDILHGRRRFIGPFPPISDYRLAAGLLFPRWNDGMERIIENLPGEYPCVKVTQYGRHSIHFHVSVAITPEVVERLREERVVEEIREWGHANPHKLQLSDRGKRLVVQEWFADPGFHDYMLAGATYDGHTHEMVWRW